MWRLLADENFNADIVRGLMLREPLLDLLTAQDAGLVATDDREILAWAADNERILLTHDLATMTAYAYQRIAAGHPMPGVFYLSNRLPVGRAIAELLTILACTEPADWNGRTAFIPL